MSENKPTHALHVGPSGSMFWKDYDFFTEQGGLKSAWGKGWVLVSAPSEESALAYAYKHLSGCGGLYCTTCFRTKWNCGSSVPGSCVAPPEAVRCPK